VGRRGDLPAVLNAFDLLVVASERETGPLVLLEALATGVPVVSTPVGYAPDLLPADALFPVWGMQANWLTGCNIGWVIRQGCCGRRAGAHVWPAYSCRLNGCSGRWRPNWPRSCQPPVEMKGMICETDTGSPLAVHEDT
jgi:hypothetical protein